MDISNFMSWFVQQVVKIFTWAFNLLDSITFGGTSLLKVTITISILVPLLMTLLTVSRNSSVTVARSDRVNSKKEDKE